ncbi:FMRFamide receptor-like [Patella vulgata]|uniref:FMRFamide receptor-like n=1 Tax=Patella vulgata TaxID=6465 RepID=UPI0024A828A8|nr:FMRFamide receptor-like [Patella vulgata]
MNITDILSKIHELRPEERIQLFELIGITNEDDLRQYLVGGYLSPRDEQAFLNYQEYRIHKTLLIYIPPILLILGTFGNIFAFLVLRHKAMSRLSTYLFLAVLSVADSLVLGIGLLRLWVGELSNFDIRDQADWLCKCIITLGYVWSDFSVWLIVAVTLERYIVVAYPLKAQRLCSVQKAKKTIFALLITFVAINMHFFWTVGLHQSVNGGEMKCDSSPDHAYLVNVVWPWIDALLYSFVPFVLILIFNILIIFRIFRATTGREYLQNRGKNIRRFNLEGNSRLTIMLLTVSFTFLVTTLPMNIGIIGSFFWNKRSHNVAEMSKLRLFVTVAELLMYLNHSINFFLYCATGQKFRNEIVKMVCVRFGHIPTPDHSQHLYCSRGCSVSGNNNIIRKSVAETEV